MAYWEHKVHQHMESNVSDEYPVSPFREFCFIQFHCEEYGDNWEQKIMSAIQIRRHDNYDN